MKPEMQSERARGARSSTRRLMAVSSVLFAGLALSLASPALAVLPFSGAQATALVGGTPLVNAVCPPGSGGDVAGGVSTNGIATVGFPAGARCTDRSAAADGEYVLATEATTATKLLRFSADCDGNTGVTGGGVDVPVGTRINGATAVLVVTTVTTLNTSVVFPNGTTATLNVVTPTPSTPADTSVTRSAIVVDGARPITIGRVICGNFAVYPLSVDVSASSPTPAAFATPAAPASASSRSSSTTLLLIGGFGLAVLAQVAVGLRRRANATS